MRVGKITEVTHKDNSSDTLAVRESKKGWW